MSRLSPLYVDVQVFQHGVLRTLCAPSLLPRQRSVTVCGSLLWISGLPVLFHRSICPLSPQHHTVSVDSCGFIVSPEGGVCIMQRSSPSVLPRWLCVCVICLSTGDLEQVVNIHKYIALWLMLMMLSLKVKLSVIFLGLFRTAETCNSGQAAAPEPQANAETGGLGRGLGRSKQKAHWRDLGVPRQEL